MYVSIIGSSPLSSYTSYISKLVEAEKNHILLFSLSSYIICPFT